MRDIAISSELDRYILHSKGAKAPFDSGIESNIYSVYILPFPKCRGKIRKLRQDIAEGIGNGKGK